MQTLKGAIAVPLTARRIRAFGSEEPADWLKQKENLSRGYTAGHFCSCPFVSFPFSLENSPSNLPALSPWRIFLCPEHFHPSSHLCAASPLFNCSLLMAGLCLTHRRCPPAPPLPWEAQAASRQIFSMLTLPWPLHGEVPKFSLSFYFLPSLAKILISGSRHLLHFSDQSSCPSRMFSIPGSLRGSRVTHRKKNEVITISSLI